VASYTLANFRVAFNSSVVALTIFFQALGAFASTPFLMGITHHFVSESPRVLGQNRCTSSFYSICFAFGVEAVVALASR
jgi:glycerol uptake facilitator-like aquaporin